MKPEAQHSKLWVAAAALALVVPASWALVRASVRSGDPTAALGLRLGMTAADVRARFTHEGSWETSVGDDGVVRLDFAASSPDANVTEARFEVHDGMLVAVRATLRDPSSDAGSAREIAPEAVRTRTLTEEGTLRIVLIARNCPAHAREVAQILAAP